MQIMVSMTNTTTFGISKNKIIQIVGTTLIPKQCKLTSYDTIEMKPVDIVFGQKIDNIKEVNKNYATTLTYKYFDAENKINYEGLLLLTTGEKIVFSSSKHN